MSKLSHPIRAIREPFGTAGLIVAMIALVAALGGTALAASKLNSTQKKEVEKIAKKFAGKPGAAGTPGAAGDKGASGAAGSAGSGGAAGAAGKSVVIATATTCGPQGGSTIEVEGSGVKKSVCNGKEGSFGGQTLPSGKTLSGHWAASGFGEAAFPEPGFGEALGSASFALPLESAPTHSHYVAEGEPTPAGCLGDAAEPAAEAGNLCVFAESETNVGQRSLIGNDLTAGFTVRGITAGAGTIALAGTWAVSAE